MVIKHIWITWERQRRNRELSKALGAELFELGEVGDIENIITKYVVGISRTLKILRESKARVVYCQNPSIILSLLVVLFKKIFGYIVCVDSHNAGINPFDNKFIVFRILSKFIQKYADITIVTNDNLGNVVMSNGGDPVVLQDKIPNICNEGNVLKLFGQFNVLFICSFASDEPYANVIDASAYIDDNVCIYISGDYSGKIFDISSLPDNVILLGYVDEEAYELMLHSVDAIIDLTTREDCLVCGAYEGVAVGKPMVLSNTTALKDYFNMGVIYTDHDSPSIADAIMKVIKNKEILSLQVGRLKDNKEEEWHSKKLNLVKKINTLSCGDGNE